MCVFPSDKSFRFIICTDRLINATLPDNVIFGAEYKHISYQLSTNLSMHTLPTQAFHINFLYGKSKFTSFIQFVADRLNRALHLLGLKTYFILFYIVVEK